MKMKCQDIDIWIQEASDEQILEPSVNVAEHLSICEHCSQKVMALRQSYQLIYNQQSEKLNDEKTQVILQSLLERVKNGNDSVLGRIYISRIAAILIIAFGMLLGLLTGGFFDAHEEENNPWSEEFTLLSDNNDSMFD